MARYRKIDPRIWKDERFIELNQKEKLIAVYCLTAQSNRIGLFNFSPSMGSEDLEMLPLTFQEGFGNVCKKLNWSYDKHFRILYFPTWWKYNKPENPNVLKSCLQDLHELPQTLLIQSFARNLKYLPETLHVTFREGLAKRMPHQEQEQEQEQEQDIRELSIDSSQSSEPDVSDDDPPNNKCPQQKIIELYHKIIPEMPKVRIWNEDQKSWLRARWREDRARQKIDWWSAYFTWIRESDWLMGRTKEEFQCDLEWLIRKRNFAKIANGRYHRKKRGQFSGIDEWLKMSQEKVRREEENEKEKGSS